MSLPRTQAAVQAERRALLAQAAASAQRPAEPPLPSGSDHLPKQYDRDAVQVALDGLMGSLSERILSLEARRGG